MKNWSRLLTKPAIVCALGLLGIVFIGALAAVWYSGCFSPIQPPESPHDDDSQLAGSQEDIPKFANKGTKSVTNSIGMKLVFAPAGEFMMGNNHSVADEISLL